MRPNFAFCCTKAWNKYMGMLVINFLKLERFEFEGITDLKKVLKQ